MTRSHPTSRLACLLLATSLGCATSAGAERAAPAERHLAGEAPPHPYALPDPAVREPYRQALIFEQRAHEAKQAGREGEAADLFARAGDAQLAFLASHPESGWDEALRYHAARLYLAARRYKEAVAIGTQLARQALDPMSRALGALLAANAETEGGMTPPLRIPAVGEPRPPVQGPLSPSWQRYVEAARAVLAEQAPPEPRRALTPGQVGLIAGQTAFAAGRLEEARALLDAVVRRPTVQQAVFETAATLYLRTYSEAGDWAGYGGALDRLRSVASAPAAQAEQGEGGASAAAPGQGEAEGAGQRGRVEAVDAADHAIRFAHARSLFAAGKYDEAAARFEALATAPAGDPAVALDAAALSHERAGALERAEAVRRDLLEHHGDARVAPASTLALAALQARRGDHAGAARTYAAYLERWPEGEGRCAALRNGAIALDQAGTYGDAVARYLGFARDPRCRQAAPDAAALAFYRAGRLLLHVGRRADAAEAFRAVLTVEGVTSPEGRQAAADARKRAGKGR